nr:hypothetical protein [Pseudomonas sp.]
MLGACVSLVTASAFAQFPAGTSRDDQGSRPSPMGNPTPQETMETHKDHRGRTVIEDGRPVQQMENGDAESKDSERHSSPGGPTDPASDPGTLE